MFLEKHSSKIIIGIMSAAVAACILAVVFSDQLTALMGGMSVHMEYESALFDTDEIITINIEMDEDSWNTMLNNATSEEYYVCNVVINGKRVNNVAIRPKGNTSLSAIAMDPDTDRYSLKLEFDHFVEGQTCFGLDKLILNNNYADATNMKEAVIYDMFQYLGADASLYNYAKVSLNGEYWGVYLALEGVEDSFMLRNYGTQDGELYKPDTMEMGGGESSSKSSGSSSGSGSSGFSFGGGMPSGNFPSGGDKPSGNSPSGGGMPSGGGSFPSGDFDFSNMPDMGNFDPSQMGDFDPSNMGNFDFSNMGDFDPSQMGDFDPSQMGDFDFSNMPDMGDFDMSDMGGFSFSNGGANLNYSDDDLDSYSEIWAGAVTDISKSDKRKVVTALKNISTGTDLEKYLDVDNVLKYMAVHTFAVNMDSLSGSMSHNYYLYEYEGMLNIFPWDYNLSLGGMSMGGSSDGTSLINDAIDTPFAGTKFFDSLLENDEYRAQYHAYLQQLVDEYVNGGRFDEVYNRIRSQIDTLVETDPTAFYTYDEYKTAAQILYNTVKLRAESIKGQLDGTIPSTDQGQKQDSSTLIDGSSLDISAMGQFSMGMGGGFSRDDETVEESSAPAEVTESGDFSGMPSGDFDPSQMGDFDFSSMPGDGDFDPQNMPDMGGQGGMSFPGGDQNGMSFPGVGQGGGMSFPGGGQMSMSIPGQNFDMTKIKNIAVFAGCLLLMVIALFVVKGVKRRKV